MARFTGKTALCASALAAVGASACCVAPLALLALGISGSWIGHLTAMEPYRPIFVVLTLVFLALAFRKLYARPSVCDLKTPCADPKVIRRQRLAFWIVTIALLALLAIPRLAPLFY
jgi:mercuric ion transport protein